MKTSIDKESAGKSQCDCKGTPKIVNTCPDLSKFVLKSSIPPCAPKPDMSKYVLE